MGTKNDDEGKTFHTSTWTLEDRHFPNDVALRIVSMLKVPDLCALGSSSVFWRQLCASDFIWASLAKKRWPCLDLCGNNEEKNLNMSQNAESSGYSKLAVPSQGWRAFYIKLHAEMAERAHSLVELVKQSARYESLEVGDYQRAMEHLSKTKMGFKDVQLYLLTAKHSVLVNLIGLHYCLACLGIQSEYVKEALAKNRIADKHICLRWWSLGQWVNGFRRGDEMHVCIAPLSKLLEPKQEQFLYVIQRGAIHEVLRVQISADFRSSAWVARDMHSQR
ncbi:uncharacterized protein LOC131042847 [Cryptomeria japonica]|uniref:uncharacterized protein LOC131042847 n=1 Tax=Cryptomeria japonica TaxID=3369 RepID=UPI0027DA86A0|nr:uncharacterized protein LOC131042847 [Cryptomeria japonica]XP_057832154.2 uncharacterized protein LOC131042847 [Cryptomeria japonica]XP_057832155.2 uncharacterized protein LOC131042847 [Cryptomeria japonica]